MRTRTFKQLAVLAAAIMLAAALLAPAAFAAETATSAMGAADVTVAASDVDASAKGSVTVSEDTKTALDSNASFGISTYTRQNKGTNKQYSNVYYGYRYAMAAESAFSIVVIDQTTAIVYIAPDMLDSLGLSVNDPTFRTAFFSTLFAIDDAASNGGTTLSSLTDMNYIFTSDKTVVRGGYTYRFGVEIEEGHYYTTVTQEGTEDGGGGALFDVTGTLTMPSATTLQVAPTGFAAFARFIRNLDWSPLWVSLRTTLVAIVVIFILGLLAAWWTIGVSDKTKGILDTIFTIPMVLPPTVCGFLLLLLFGNSTAFGRWLIDHGISLVFTWPAAVIACIVVGFPLMYRTARGAFESLDPAMLDAARTLGWREGRVFTKLMLPLAWPTIASGTVLAFARAMGEFGATLFFAGNFVGVTQTIPIAIYFDWMGGQTDVAMFWVVVVILISFLVILFINMYSSHTQKFRAGYRMRKSKHGSEKDAPMKGEVVDA